MKKSFVIALALLVNAIAFGSTPSFIKNVTEKTFVLDLKQWKNSSINVTIKNENGGIVYSEKIESPKAGRKYNLSRTEDGVYTFVIEDAQKFVLQSVEIKRNDISVDTKTEEIFKPIFKTSTDVWVIQAMALKQNAEIKIVNENGDVVFKEKIEKPVVERKYNVAKLEKGKFEIIYSVGNEIFTHTAFKK